MKSDGLSENSAAIAADKKSDEKFKTSSAGKVSEWLKSKGWKISSVSIRNHTREGKLRKEYGYYNEDAILAYATKWLKRVDTGRKIPGTEIESLQEQKLRADIEASKARAAKAKFELEVAKNAYIPRGDFERELASRAAVFEHGLRHFIESSVAEMIALCDGNMAKTLDVTEWLLNRVELSLHEYSTLKEWHVMEIRPAKENTDEADYKRFKVTGYTDVSHADT